MATFARKRKSQQDLEQRFAFERESGRKQFTSGLEDADPDIVRALWNAALDILRPSLAYAKIDLFPDPSWGKGFDSLHEDARQGWHTLHGLTEEAIPHGMGVWVDLADSGAFSAFRDYGLESIHCLGYSRAAAERDGRKPDLVIGPLIVMREPNYPLAYNHDQGSSLAFELTEDEHTQLDSRMRSEGIGLSACMFRMA